MAGIAARPFSSMGREEEGNYASTMGSYTRDQDTDHGLTLPPKIQSDNLCGEFEGNDLLDLDLDAFLGQSDPYSETPRYELDDHQDESWSEQVFHQPEPSAKRRKLTPPPWSLDDELPVTFDEAHTHHSVQYEQCPRDTISASCFDGPHDHPNGFVNEEESTSSATIFELHPSISYTSIYPSTPVQPHIHSENCTLMSFKEPYIPVLTDNHANHHSSKSPNPRTPEITHIDLTHEDPKETCIDVDDSDSLFGDGETEDMGGELESEPDAALEAELEAALLEESAGTTPIEDSSASPLCTGAHSTRSSSVQTRSSYSAPDIAYSTTASTPRVPESRSPTPAFISRLSLPSLPPEPTPVTTPASELSEARTSQHPSPTASSKRRVSKRRSPKPLPPQPPPPVYGPAWAPSKGPQALSKPTPRSPLKRRAPDTQSPPASEMPKGPVPALNGPQSQPFPVPALRPTHCASQGESNPAPPFSGPQFYHQNGPQISAIQNPASSPDVSASTAGPHVPYYNGPLVTPRARSTPYFPPSSADPIIPVHNGFQDSGDPSPRSLPQAPPDRPLDSYGCNPSAPLPPKHAEPMRRRQRPGMSQKPRNSRPLTPQLIPPGRKENLPAVIQRAWHDGFQYALNLTNGRPKPSRPQNIQAMMLDAESIPVDLAAVGPPLTSPAPSRDISYAYSQQDILGGVIDKMTAELKRNSPVKPHVIPPQFSATFGALEKKFHEDVNFKNSVLMWGVQKLVSMKEEKTDLGMEDTAHLVSKLQGENNELRKEKGELLKYVAYLERESGFE